MKSLVPQLAKLHGLKPRLKVLDFMLWERGAAIYDTADKG